MHPSFLVTLTLKWPIVVADISPALDYTLHWERSAQASCRVMRSDIVTAYDEKEAVRSFLQDFWVDEFGLQLKVTQRSTLNALLASIYRRYGMDPPPGIALKCVPFQALALEGRWLSFYASMPTLHPGSRMPPLALRPLPHSKKKAG